MKRVVHVNLVKIGRGCTPSMQELQCNKPFYKDTNLTNTHIAFVVESIVF